jgi:hypothetical protein
VSLLYSAFKIVESHFIINTRFVIPDPRDQREITSVLNC